MSKSLWVVIAVALVQCDQTAPSDDLITTTRMIGVLDQRAIKYGCPATRPPLLNEADPFLAVAEFVRVGAGLKSWADDGENDIYMDIPADVKAGLDSLRVALADMAPGFERAAGHSHFVQRECYGQFPLPCDTVARARNLLSIIDERPIRDARERYFRHREDLIKTYEPRGLPLGPPPSCEGGASNN